MYKTWGYLPEWPLLSNPSTIMEGDPSTIILAESALQVREAPAFRGWRRGLETRAGVEVQRPRCLSMHGRAPQRIDFEEREKGGRFIV